MDSQTLLVLILLVLTTNVLFVGVYIIFVLKELRLSISKLNRLLDTVNEVSAVLSRPLIGAAEAVEGFRQGFKLMRFLKNWKKSGLAKKGKGEEEAEEEE